MNIKINKRPLSFNKMVNKEITIPASTAVSAMDTCGMAGVILEVVAELTGLSDEQWSYIIENRDNIEIVKNEYVPDMLMSQIVIKK